MFAIFEIKVTEVKSTSIFSYLPPAIIVILVLGLFSIPLSRCIADEPDKITQHTTKQPAENQNTNELADLSIEELMNVQVVVTASRQKQKINTV